MDALLTWSYQVVWGWPLLALIVGLGVYLTVALKGLQFRYLGYAISLIVNPGGHGKGGGDISHFQSLMTALAATLGIGNIAGVATALSVGGFGALFWMWVTALAGMSIKFCEAFLAVRFRHLKPCGEMAGGPMYFIRDGLGWRWLAGTFAFCGTLAALGGGNMIQANSVADVLAYSCHIPPVVTACGLLLVCSAVLLKGIKRIGQVAAVLVPAMGVIYLGGALLVLIINFTQIPGVLYRIIVDAWNPSAAAGGVIGMSIIHAIQVGVSRGLMTSEAGLGTASIAAAAAKTDCPGSQAMVSMTGSFFATVVMCTITGLVLGVSGVVDQYAPLERGVVGASLTMRAFESAYPYGGLVVVVATVLFGLTTLLGWAYYGEKCAEYMFGDRGMRLYRIVFIAAIVPGAMLNLPIVWRIADICNGLMAYPNLIGILFLAPYVVRETREYLSGVDREIAAGMEIGAL